MVSNHSPEKAENVGIPHLIFRKTKILHNPRSNSNRILKEKQFTDRENSTTFRHWIPGMQEGSKIEQEMDLGNDLFYVLQVIKSIEPLKAGVKLSKE